MKLELTHSAIFALLTTSMLSFPTVALAQASPQKILRKIDLYQQNTTIEETEQITQVHQLQDLSPDWSYEALRNLAEKYGCIKGFSNRTFKGDRTLLRQLFTNLLQNAIHYTSAGGSITEDTGIGIAPEHLNSIFERFWRADKSRSYQTGKSGLGLAIVREIVRLHHGRVVVKSELGKDSCFSIHFPQA